MDFQIDQPIALASLEATQAFGAELARVLAAAICDRGEPMLLGLSGDLGAGKSTLTRAIGAALGIERAMPSPTFTLEQRYPMVLPADQKAGESKTDQTHGGLDELRHWDFYRLDEMSDMSELGFYDRAPGDLIIVEWIERRPEVLEEEAGGAAWLYLSSGDIAEIENPDDAPRTATWKRLPEFLASSGRTG